VTMLLVTGSAPILNSAVAAVSTPPPSAANAGTPVERSAKRNARWVALGKIRTDVWKYLKRVVVRNRPSLRQQLKSKKLCRRAPHALSACHVFPIVMIATAPMMTIAARNIRMFMGSPSIAQPRNMATTGFTYAYVDSLTGVLCSRSQT
jgi:hypothetical protein